MFRCLARLCCDALDRADYLVTSARLRVLDWIAGPREVEHEQLRAGFRRWSSMLRRRGNGVDGGAGAKAGSLRLQPRKAPVRLSRWRSEGDSNPRSPRLGLRSLRPAAE
jgi:hypothetical protein